MAVNRGCGFKIRLNALPSGTCPTAPVEQAPMSHFLEPLLRTFRHVLKVQSFLFFTKKVYLFSKSAATKQTPSTMAWCSWGAILS